MVDIYPHKDADKIKATIVFYCVKYYHMVAVASPHTLNMELNTHAFKAQYTSSQRCLQHFSQIISRSIRNTQDFLYLNSFNTEFSICTEYIQHRYLQVQFI